MCTYISASSLILSHIRATVFFADIAGFTAWSSSREPAQVFTLLETLYGAFDKIAKRRRVFKVETIGDCYVAVCGLPDPRKEHAVVMSRFSRDVFHKFNELTRRLEMTLGPDTADLAIRVGLHSGPVTAGKYLVHSMFSRNWDTEKSNQHSLAFFFVGVLRGDRARFQLYVWSCSNYIHHIIDSLLISAHSLSHRLATGLEIP